MARRSPPADPLLRGTVRLRHHGVTVDLQTGEGVFSGAGIDPGTAFLLRWLATHPQVQASQRVLDLGCGYGPLALWLAAAAPARRVTAVDRDALAVECTRLGADANDLGERVVAEGSLGYDDVGGEPVDLIVSNIPAKIGPAALGHLLLDARFHLADAGVVSVVVVDRLAAEVTAVLADPAVEVLDHRANRSYATWTYRFVGDPSAADPRGGFDRGVYRRGRAPFEVGRVRWEASTSYAVAEFDTLSHGTGAAVELLAARPLPGPVAVVGVGQGHTALAVGATTGADVELRLVDRDLLALRTAAANAGVPTWRHTARPAGELEGCRSAVVALPEKQPVALTAALLAPAVAELPAGAPLVLHGRTADVSRVLELLRRGGVGLTVDDRRTRAGHAAARVRTPR